jgi:serine/threonine protein kinase
MDKYEFLDHLGEGKFGNVFKAQHKITQSYVAVKQNTSSYNMLRREATIIQYLCQKNISNIPRVLYYGKIEDIFYLVIPFYSHNLHDYFEQKRPSREHTKLLIYKCVEILQHVHYNDIVHCDIKPENFMIHGGKIILIDFGLANYITLLRTKNDHVIGSPRFMSYFVHCGDIYSYKDDLISLLYMYLLFCQGGLPWDNLEITETCDHEPSHILHVNNIAKRDCKRLEKFMDCDSSLYELFDYLYNVDGFPDYEKIRELLI